MSLVVILYLALLSVFTLGYLYKGVSLLKNEVDEPGRKRIRFSLKAQEADDVDFELYRKHNARLSLFMGLLYLALIAVTFRFVPNLFGTLTIREIHLVRTCNIAVLTLHFFRDILGATFRDKIVKRKEKTGISRYDMRHSVAFVVLSAALIYSVYTQITYSW